MKNNIIIDMGKILAPIIGSRDVAESLFNDIRKLDAQAIHLDFAHVEFISRSAAHELIILKEKISNIKNILFINTNAGVSDMLRTVAANRVSPKRDKPEFKAHKVDIGSFSNQKALRV